MRQLLDCANYVTLAAAKSRQLAANQSVTVFQEIQKFLDPAPRWTSARGHLNLHILIDDEVLLPRVLLFFPRRGSLGRRFAPAMRVWRFVVP